MYLGENNNLEKRDEIQIYLIKLDLAYFNELDLAYLIELNLAHISSWWHTPSSWI